MSTDDILQPMYTLAYFLHPDETVAFAITLDAADRLTRLLLLRDQPAGHEWHLLPEAWLPQYCVYLASDLHERVQERLRAGRAVRERPTQDDYLVRYLKCLIWWTIDRTACHVAVALGCFLYRYLPGDLVQLAPALCAPRQIQQIRARLTQRLQARFPRTHLFPGDHGTDRTPSPTASDCQLVQRALAMFTPWWSAHVRPPALDQSLLGTYFDPTSRRSDEDRIHALINPVDGGLPRLIREYNASFPRENARCLAEPDTKLAIPRFAR
jgi:hypothetical protein